MPDKKKLSVKNLIGDHVEVKKENSLSSDFLPNKDKVSFYRPGTKVIAIRNGDEKIPVNGFYIERVTFSSLESVPLYHLKKLYVDEDSGNIFNHTYKNISEKELVVEKPLIKSYLTKQILITSSDDKSITSLSGKKLLGNDTFLSLESLVHLRIEKHEHKFNKESKRLKIHFISEIYIDRDLNVYYTLDKKYDCFYTNNDLNPCLGKRNPDNLEEISIEIVKIELSKDTK